MLLTVLDCGLRLGEVSGLRRRCILDDWLVVDGKSGLRQVPVSPELSGLLQKCRAGRTPLDGSEGTVDAVWSPASLSANVPSGLAWEAGKPALTPCATPLPPMYLRAGGGVHQLQQIMGHQKVETTMIYVHLAGKDMSRQTMQLIHRRGRWGFWPKRATEFLQSPDCC